MEDLSLHILDIVENSIEAKANKIEIIIVENKKKNLLSIKIIDNGLGMDKTTIRRAVNPFYTTKKVRRFGLGLSMLSNAAKTTNGTFSISSKKNKGTIVKAEFEHDHIDRQPLGDMKQTILTLVMGNPEINLFYTHKKNHHKYFFSTKKIKSMIDGNPINSPTGIKAIAEDFKKNKNNQLEETNE
jgi:anti-sigma regulatory factor (Ser/Thr protein kinase)